MKTSVKALIVSLIINAIGVIVNLIFYLKHKSLLLAVPMNGGEWTGQAGFGMLLNHTYPMTIDGVTNGTEQIWLQFEPISLIVTLLLAFIPAYIILKICSKVYGMMKRLKKKG